MKRKTRRVLLIFLGLVCLLLSVPVVLTWRALRQDRLNRALIAAVKRNDDKAVVSLLNQGANANCRDEPPPRFSMRQMLRQALHPRSPQASHAPTPLLIALEPQEQSNPYGFACCSENVRLVQALLDHGAQVNLTDAGGMSPLEWAILSGKNATVRLLLSRGANTSVQYEQTTGYPTCKPLVTAAQVSKIEIGVIAELIDRGADVNQRDNNGFTALRMATREKRVDVIRLLLSRHADPNLADQNGRTPVAQALDDDSPQSRQIVRLLKAAGGKQ